MKNKNFAKLVNLNFYQCETSSLDTKRKHSIQKTLNKFLYMQKFIKYFQ